MDLVVIFYWNMKNIMEDKMSEKQSINFLRGVPAEEALSRLVQIAADGYGKVINQYGTDVPSIWPF